MIASVAAALRHFGGRKVGTPLQTASTPVSAVQPEANARSTRTTSSSPERAVVGRDAEVRRLGATARCPVSALDSRRRRA